MLDTSVLVDLAHLTEADLPTTGVVTAVSLAELLQGIHVTADAAIRAERIDHARAIERMFPKPLPFDAAAAHMYASLVALVVAAARNPRARRMDLMIAATAAVNELPLYTRDPTDFRGLDSRLTVVPV